MALTGRVVDTERRACFADRRAVWWLASELGRRIGGGCSVQTPARVELVTVTTSVIRAGRSRAHRLLCSGRGHRPHKQLPWSAPSSHGVVRRAGSSRPLQTRSGCVWGIAAARCGGCALASGSRGARLGGVSALCGRCSWRDHRISRDLMASSIGGSGSGHATPVNHAASDRQGNDRGPTHRPSEAIANATDGDGCWQRARCGKAIAIVCWRGAQCRFLIASGGGSRAEQWIRCMGGVRR